MHKALGDLLTASRLKAGIRHQSALAEMIGVKQQTVSRWEQGASRPRPDQIGVIAATLGIDPGLLMAAAGYARKQVVATYDQPIPFDSLSPESFERAVEYLLARLHRDAAVHRAGARGHTQDGIDIDVRFPSGDVHTYQCKRVEQFGPEKVHAAIGRHSRQATKKFLVLSRIATPQARLATHAAADWDIWDKEDLSRAVRDLSKDDQRRFVDVFFRGQRLALLGEPEIGPWQSLEEFFAPFQNDQGAFNHTWHLIGRDEELASLSKSLCDPTITVTMLVGAGGAGKSRILKHALEVFQQANSETSVRFLSATDAPTKKSIDDLGAVPLLLVVDDAHDRSDIDLLFQHVSVANNNARLVLSLRNYGLDFLKHRAAQFAIVGGRIATTAVNALTKAQATELARSVLEKRDGPVEAAKDIARLTSDCPLATVMAAHVISKDGRPYELVKNEAEFRFTLMKGFYQVAAGSIGPPNEHERIRGLLRILALVQPFVPEDPALHRTVAAVEGLKDHDIARLIRLLSEAGILFKRGGQYRLSPDLLADHIIEEVCIGLDGNSTGYAERVFEAVDGAALEHLVANLGKLDWRRANGKPSNSRLLDGIWKKLQPTEEYGDAHMRAVTAVAYYQPSRALDFVDRQIRTGKLLTHLPQILKYVAYNWGYLPDALSLLWHLGRQDRRETHNQTDHAIRILRDLCEVSKNKPREFIERVVDFGIDLLPRKDSWEHAYTPLDFLGGILQSDGHEAEAEGLTVTFTNFTVSHAFAAALRSRVVDALVGLLKNSDARVAFEGAKHLSEALRYPMNVSDRSPWAAEFGRTLQAVENTIATSKIPAIVHLEIAKSIKWHAHYGDGLPSEIASRILGSLPNDLEFRVTLAMCDGYGMLLDELDGDFEQRMKTLAAERIALAREVQSAFPDAQALYQFIDSVLAAIERLQERNGSPHNFLSMLFAEVPALATVAITRALDGHTDALRNYLALALATLLNTDRRAEALEFIERLFLSGDPVLQGCIGPAYGLTNFTAAPSDTDIANIRRLLASEQPALTLSGTAALSALRAYPRHMVSLLRHANLSHSKTVADRALMFLHLDNRAIQAALSPEDVVSILKQLRSLDELDAHWIEEFIAHASSVCPVECAEFFMWRVEYAAQHESWKMRPCNHPPYGQIALRFRSSSACAALLRRISDWMTSKPDAHYLFGYRAAELFNSMFAPIDDVIVGHLSGWMLTADERGLHTISRILREGRNDLVFTHRDFILALLERCQQFGSDCYRQVAGELYAATISGMRSGTPGVPFKQDEELRDNAKTVLSSLSRGSPGYDLYQDLIHHAEQNISRSLREREAWE